MPQAPSGHPEAYASPRWAVGQPAAAVAARAGDRAVTESGWRQPSGPRKTVTPPPPPRRPNLTPPQVGQPPMRTAPPLTTTPSLAGQSVVRPVGEQSQGLSSHHRVCIRLVGGGRARTGRVPHSISASAPVHRRRALHRGRPQAVARPAVGTDGSDPRDRGSRRRCRPRVWAVAATPVAQCWARPRAHHGARQRVACSQEGADRDTRQL